MNLKVVLVFFVIIFQKKCSARQTSLELKKVFVDLANSLMERAQSVTILRLKTSKEESDPVSFKSIAAIPHIVARIPLKLKKFELETDAIVSLNSVASYDVLENSVFVSAVSSMVKQIIVFLHGETTFDDLKKLTRFQ